MTDEPYMQLAIDVCRTGIQSGQTPFGAVMVRGDEVVASTHNQVWLTTDITAHAEIACIRAACRRLATIDLTGCTIYSTTEPCPMCFSAIHWAKIDRIVYGAAIPDAQRAGFSELTIPNEQMKKLGGSDVEIVAGCMREQCAKLFDEWLARFDRRVY